MATSSLSCFIAALAGLPARELMAQAAGVGRVGVGVQMCKQHRGGRRVGDGTGE